jgi:phthalate 4,5-cis-dihydrodiol dehydrogenase
MASAKQADMIRIGILGLGAAGRAFLPAFKAHAGFDLIAIADPVAEVRDGAARDLGVAVFADLPAMLDGVKLDAVYIATPTDLHPEHAALAFAAGKHVLTEKPMAVNLEQARAMVEAADKAGIILSVGHSHSYDLPIQRMAELIDGGAFGRVRMINTWCYTDWIYRPRRPDELKSELGGGVTYRQGSHQFDIIRLLGGGLLKSVRGTTFDWDPARSAIGAHTAFLTFQDGTAATAIYNGYGGFSTMEIGDDISEWGFKEPFETRKPTTRTPANVSPEEELARKRKRAQNAIPASAPFQPYFGVTLVSCEKGDIRQSPDGLYVYGEHGRKEIRLLNDKSPRDLVVAEFHGAITGVRKPVHDGRWGLANLETCAAVIESSRIGQEVFLAHQVASKR